MIIVKIELAPGGLIEHTRSIGLLQISNCTRPPDPDFGDYIFTLCDVEKSKIMYQGKIYRHDRKQDAWVLVLRCLEEVKNILTLTTGEE